MATILIRMSFNQKMNIIILFIFKISDWTGNTYQDRRYMNKYNAQIGAGGTQYAYYHEEDESSFQLVSQEYLGIYSLDTINQFYITLIGN